MTPEYWREKKREQRAAKKMAATLTKVPEKEVAKTAPTAKLHSEWDSQRYPIKAAWDIAVERAARARVYAKKFPEHVRPNEEIFQEVSWQYDHEGVPAVTEKDRVTLRKPQETK